MSQILSIISSACFYLLPLFLGVGINSLLAKSKKIDIISSFITGSLFFAFLFSFFFYSAKFVFNLPVDSNLLTAFGRGLALLALLLNLPQLGKWLNLVKNNYKPLTIVFLISLVCYFLWRERTIFPLPLNWDFFHHQTLVNEITNGNFNLLNSKISDTFIFNGYSPLFHLALTWPQLVFKPEILSFFWGLEFFHLLTALLASFYLAKTIFNCQKKALLTTVFSALIFESFMAYTTLILIPQTLLAVVFTVLAAKLLKKERVPFFSILTGLLFLFLLHYVIGGFAVLTLIMLVLLNKFKKELKKRWVIETLIFLAILAILTLQIIPFPESLKNLNQGEGAAFDLSLQEKYDYIKMFAGLFLPIFFMIGSLVTVLGKNLKLKIALLVCLAILTVVLAPFPYSFKFLSLSHYWLIIIAVAGFYFLWHKINFPLLKNLSLILTILSLMVLFVSSGKFIKNILQTENNISQISIEEVEAANFLKSNFQGKDFLLVSDPATQQILEPLSLINSQGGAYMNKDSRLVLDQFNSNPDQTNQKIKQIQDEVKNTPQDKYLLVLSGRYFAWQKASLKQKQDLNFNIWAPVKLSLENQLQIREIVTQNQLQIVYQNQTLIIVLIEN